MVFSANATIRAVSTAASAGTRSGFCRQHDGVGAVEDSAGNVRRPCPSRPEPEPRLQHLGCGDDRLPTRLHQSSASATAEGFRRHFHTEVATATMMPFRNGQNLFEALDRLRLNWQ